MECYPGQLNQVLMNILVNAAQAIEDEGAIWIKTYAEHHNIVIKIKDTGGGIPKGALKDVFNPFFTTKPAGQGTGLGLSISYGIVKKHGGEITVESEPGVGTEFTIVLPLDGVEKARERARHEGDSARSQYEFFDASRIEELEKELAQIDANSSEPAKSAPDPRDEGH